MIAPKLPKHEAGQHVRALVDLLNDGSFPDAPPAALLAGVGDIGEIVKVGTHVESSEPVYLVEFGDNMVIGCLEQEIAALDSGASKAGRLLD
jgi:nitrogen fixation protein NifZ